jgi:hypothetical protein
MMDHNPYSPPQTEVREPASPNEIGARPKQVTLAVRLFWVEFAVSVVSFAAQMLSKDRNPYVVATVITVGVFLAAEAFVIYSLWVRRNWARYVALATTLLGFLEVVVAIGDGRLKGESVQIGAEAIEAMLDGVALFLLFTSPAKEWFKKR